MSLKGIADVVRWREWSTSKLSLTMGAYYYLLLVSGAQGWPPLLRFANLMGFLCLLASFGYTVNDYSDRAVDEAAGKHKIIFRWSTLKIRLIIIGLLAAGLLVAYPLWQKDLVLLGHIVFMYLLAAFYSLPPLRFKEEYWAGVVVASLTQRALPVLLCFMLFDNYGVGTLLFVLLAFITGVRAIFVHQLKDYGHDQATGVETLAAKWGLEKTTRRLLWRVVPLEFGLLGAVLLYVCVKVPALTLFAGGYAVASLLFQRRFTDEWLFSRVILDESLLAGMYSLVLPLAFLLVAAYSNPVLLGLALFHLAWNWPVLTMLWHRVRFSRRSPAAQCIPEGSCQAPTGNSWQAHHTPFYTEWWYFDAVFSDGHILGGSIALSGYLPLPETVRVRVEFCLASPDGGKTFQVCKDYPYRLFDHSEAGQLSVNSNTLRFSDRELFLELEEDGLSAELVFSKLVEGFQAGSDGQLFSLGEWHQHFGWCVPFPAASVTGYMENRGKRSRVEGRGYQDHNWATFSLADNIQYWHWLRFSQPDKTVIVAEMALKSRRKEPIFLVAWHEGQKWRFVHPGPVRKGVFGAHGISYEKSDVKLQLLLQPRGLLKSALHDRTPILQLSGQSAGYTRRLCAVSGALFFENAVMPIEGEAIHEFSSF